MITAAMIAMFWLGTASGVMGAVLLRMPPAGEAARSLPVPVSEATSEALRTAA